MYETPIHSALLSSLYIWTQILIPIFHLPTSYDFLQSDPPIHRYLSTLFDDTDT